MTNVQGETIVGRRPRIRILDGLRLVAALLVVSWHYVAFGHGAELHPYARVPALYPLAAYGWIGVELFFLISGFVISMSSIGHTIGEFVTSRIARLYPAYWFGVLLTTAVLIVWPHASALSPHDVAVNLTMMQSGVGVGSVDAVYWTLWTELHFYVLFTLVVWRGVTYRRTVLFCAGWLAAALFGDLAGHVGGTLGQAATTANAVAISAYAPFFVAGVAFFLIHRYGSKPVLWALAVASFAMGVDPVLLTLTGSNTHLHQHVPQWPAIVLLGAFFLLMAAIAVGWLRANWTWLGVAGTMTYPLYLIHEVIGWLILRSLNDRVPGPVLLTGTVAVMLLAAWLIHRFVERAVAVRLRAAVRAAFALLARVRRGVTGPIDDEPVPVGASESTPEPVRPPVAVPAQRKPSGHPPRPGPHSPHPHQPRSPSRPVAYPRVDAGIRSVPAYRGPAASATYRKSGRGDGP